MGILPLRTPRHAEFLHQKVAGIVVPKPVRKRMHQAEDPVAEGAANAREMLALAREGFAGACIMPPFDHYEVLIDVLLLSILFRKFGTAYPQGIFTTESQVAEKN